MPKVLPCGRCGFREEQKQYSFYDRSRVSPSCVMRDMDLDPVATYNAVLHATSAHLSSQHMTVSARSRSRRVNLIVLCPREKFTLAGAFSTFTAGTTCFGYSRERSPHSIPQYVPFLNLVLFVFILARPWPVVVCGVDVKNIFHSRVDSIESNRSRRCLCGWLHREEYFTVNCVRECFGVIEAVIKNETCCDLPRLAGKVWLCRHTNSACLGFRKQTEWGRAQCPFRPQA